MELIEAAKNGSLTEVKSLMEKNNQEQEHINRALIEAAWNGHLEVVEYLAKNGADVTAQNNLALIFATVSEHLDVIQYLLKNGAAVVNGSVLIVAARRGYFQIIQFLVEKGYFVNGIVQNYPLIYAAEDGYLNIVKFLLEHGARDLDYKALTGAIINDYKYIVKLLLEYYYPRDLIESLLTKVSNPKIINLLQGYLNQKFLISSQDQRLLRK